MRTYIVSMILFTMMLLVPVVANAGSCKHYYNKTQKALKGIHISAEDNDRRGLRRSYKDFMFYSKHAIIECNGSNRDNIENIRDSIKVTYGKYN